MNNQRVEIRSYPRIHMSLLDMNGSLGRVNGGLGFAISSPRNRISIRPSESNALKYSCRVEKETEQFLTRTANRVREFKHLAQTRIDILELLRPHQGFGSFTSTALAIIEGLLLQSGGSYTKEEIVSLSRRGGTSGIGINSYFDGKMIIDLGHAMPGKTGPSSFVPSSFSWKRGPAMFLTSIPFPRWQILFVVPRTRQLSEEEEKKFFRKVCPLPVDEVASTIRLCFFGIVPAVKNADYSAFCKMVRLLRNTSWKQTEIFLYEDSVMSVIERAEELGADAASMSSLGPLVYCFVREGKIDSVRRKLEREFDLEMTGTAYPRNEGREVLVSK